MKLVPLLFMAMMVTPGFALTSDEINVIVDQVLADEPLRLLDPKRPEEHVAHFHKRITNHLNAYAKRHNLVLAELPEAKRHELEQVVTGVSAALCEGSKRAPITESAMQRALHKALSKIIDPAVTYVDKKDIKKHLDGVIDRLCARVGLAVCECAPALQREVLRHTEVLHAVTTDRLARSNISYTTDRDIAQLQEEPMQLLLKQMWADVQMRAHKMTLAHLAKHHANSSAYVVPPEAQKLHVVAQAIRTMIKDL